MIKPGDIAFSNGPIDPRTGSMPIRGIFQIICNSTIGHHHVRDPYAHEMTKKGMIAHVVEEMYPRSLRNNIEELYHIALRNGYSYHERLGQIKHEIDNELRFNEDRERY